jgi:beta-1,4-mannooligosaccharide/beta-1,4-mannosyl-N-acetylglucosamine phosphorylase
MTDSSRAWPGADLFERHPQNPILTAKDLGYPANVVFNAAAAQVNGETVLLARVEDKRGLSHLTACWSADGVTGWRVDDPPTLLPDPARAPEEQWGIEDPRATYLPELGLWGVVYTAYSRQGTQVKLATTKDFKTFERRGVIMPPDDKNAALFPRKINGRWAILHRPVAPGRDANIWISFSPDLAQWGEHHTLMETRRGNWWDAHRIGTCPPPLETPHGWLLGYHGVRQTVDGAIYRFGLALLDLENPQRVLRRSDEWVFGPREPFERVGDVGNVVFPCGWIHDAGSDTLRLYYGAADTCIGLATAKLADVMDYMLSCPQTP